MRILKLGPFGCVSEGLCLEVKAVLVDLLFDGLKPLHDLPELLHLLVVGLSRLVPFRLLSVPPTWAIPRVVSRAIR